MQSKHALNTGIASMLLSALTGISKAGKTVGSGVAGRGRKYLKALRNETLAPGNMDELMQLHIKGGKPTPERLKALDAAIFSTAKGVETGESNITTLQTLLRERELLAPAVAGAGDILPRLMSAAGSFAAENPALTALGVALPTAAYIVRPERKHDIGE